MISVALTTYNGSKYLKDQLDSILSQKKQFDELIICDDKSSDNTPEILNKYAKIDQRIKVYHNETNLGFKKNFEKALKLCSGDYIALSDQDDIWLPNHLQSLYNNIGDRLLACGDADIIDCDGNRLNRRLSKIKNFNHKGNDCSSIFQFIAYYQNPFQGASMMLRKAFIDVALPIPTSVKFHDVWFAHLACSKDKFIYVDRPITLYRMHGNNASGMHIHKSHWRTILGHLLKKNQDNNRKEVIDALKDLTYKDSLPLQSIIQEATNYYDGDNRLCKRLTNFIFEIKNHKSIYG